MRRDRRRLGLEIGLLIYNAGANTCSEEFLDGDLDAFGVTRTPAMERAGLNFDVPGLRVGAPADVAAEGLDRLAHGPVHVAGGNEADVARRNDPDREAVVLGAHRFMQKLMGER